LNNIKTEFCTIQGKWGRRQVRYLISGTGPIIFLLHQSPKSADEYKPQISQWSSDFTIIAPDTPGYGGSDPLNAENITIQDIAEATIELADSLGIDTFGLYGFHTGASISIAIGHQFPERISSIACNGVVVLEDSALENIMENYLPPFIPQWDGGHLTWLWSRMREQLIFFPWHERTKEARMKFDISPPEILHENTLEVLRSGDHYRAAYGAAFQYRNEIFVPQLTIPNLITAASLDPLSASLKTLIPSSTSVIEESLDHQTALEKSRKHLLNFPALSHYKKQESQLSDGDLLNSIIHCKEGDIRLKNNFNNQEESLLIIHPAGGSSETINYLTDPISKSKPLISIDLPGHGESFKNFNINNLMQLNTRIINQVFDHHSTESASIISLNDSCSLSIELALMSNSRVNQLILIEPWFMDQMETDDYLEYGIPEIELDWAGGHLLKYWHMIRDSKLFWPWYKRKASAIIWEQPNIDENQLQIELTELIRANIHWRGNLREHLLYNAEGKLKDLTLPLFIAAKDSHPLINKYQSLTQELKNCRLIELPENINDWGKIILAKTQ
jgi:pimeloyl-ACP methyl ester carboxylesterase